MHLCFFFHGKCLKVLIYEIYFIRVASTIAINIGLCRSLPDPLKYASFKNHEGNTRVNAGFVFCFCLSVCFSVTINK